MKLSFMTFSTPNLSLTEVLKTAVKYGYEGVELRISAKHNHGVEITMNEKEKRKAKKIIDASKIKVVALATSCVFANKLTYEENIEIAIKSIKLAAYFNIPVIRTFGGTYTDDMCSNNSACTI